MNFQRRVKSYGIEIIRDIDINSDNFIKRAKNVDYIISIAANKIFKDKLLNAPKEMCLNIHAGLLPNYKGFNPSFWVLYNSEKVTGITIHKMTKRLDEGPIVSQEKIYIESDETWFSLQTKVTMKAGEMLKDLLPKLINKNIVSKDERKDTYIFRKPKASDGKKFRSMGKRFI